MNDLYSTTALRLTLLDPETFEKYDIYYRLFNIPLTAKWIKNFLNLRRNNYSFREKKVQFKYRQDKGKLILKFNSLIDGINSFYDKKLKLCTDIDEEVLNYLHDAYAIYGKRVEEKLKENYWDSAYLKIKPTDFKATRWPGIKFNNEMHQAFIKLNDLIHRVELSIRDPNADEYSGFIALASFEPRTDFPIEEDDLPAMKFNLDFGDLCLGYNTLGKNLKHIILDADIESLKTGMILPQTTWSNEIMTHMKMSDNNPWSQYRYYKKWQTMSPEEYGFQYGDFYKNREGYLCIGEIFPEQKSSIWDESIHKLKIDLTSFSEIFDYDLISLKNAYEEYLDPSKRNWKNPRPLLGKKIDKIINPYFSTVTWIMNDICNYSCRYCPPFLHNGTNYKQQDDWDNLSEFIHHIVDMLGSENRKVMFSISGGEPTLSPFFPQLIKKISELGHFSWVTTNLSRTSRYIEENFKYLTGASCSFHPAMEFVNNTADEFLERLKVANYQTQASARIMMDPLYWDQTIDFIDRIEKEKIACVEIVMIDSNYGTGSDTPKFADITYTKEQIDFINNFKPIYVEKYRPEQKFYPDLKTKNPEVIFEDGSTVSGGVNYQTFINNGQTNFYGYTCEIGNGSMFIHQKGTIRKANCHVGGNWGNINDWKTINWKEFKQPVTCTQLSCNCGADVPITKWKTDN